MSVRGFPSGMNDTSDKYCCDRFAKECDEYKSPLGGGWLYPPGTAPVSQIERDASGTFNVNGCCGGGCFVLTEIRFCPWCGANIFKASP